MFDIKVQNNSEVLLSGRFDAAQIERADKIFNSIDSDCIVDFQELQYISSAGLGSLIKTHVRLKNSGRIIRLRNMNNHIKEVFRYSGLDKIFQIE